MFKKILILTTMLISLAACGTPVPTLAPMPTAVAQPTIVTNTGYRPLQTGDVVEGQTIAYQYLVPTADQPNVVFAFGANLLQLCSLKWENTNNVLAYVKELGKYKDVLGFEEADPAQATPKPITWDPSKPIEIVFIYAPDFTPSHWSMLEGDDQEVYAAYKIVRRKDGGLRFIDAYGLVALSSANSTFTLNGGGGGLMFSSRLALLRLILSDAKYQRGANAMAQNPPDLKEYDARILKIDPNGSGILMNQDWFIVSRSAPTSGKPLP